MDIDYKIIKFFREFIQDVRDFEEGKRRLGTIRGTVFMDKSLKDSRAIWFSLMLYRFKKELDVSEHLWNKSRLVVIGILKRAYDIQQTINEYIDLFNTWKKDDYLHFVADIASFYYNLLEIRKSIGMTENETTKEEWEPHYLDLILKVRKSCAKIGCLDDMDRFLTTLEGKKYDLVAQIMERAYWDKVEEDLNNGDYTVLFRNLEEIKIMLKDIHPISVPEKELDEILDIVYIQQLISNGAMDQKYILGLSKFITGYLKDWDAIHFRKRYDETLYEINSMKDVTLTKLIREVFQRISVLVLDFKTRKSVWEKLLSRQN